ncbi:3'-5' ssDNA/RNA exonuclease TatD-like [Lineus longissimus]|uniref:3'-5' ssDNA/RNA exonuclease TatD-like n=1 Tax=Lineus longissimus TaxID=88925 RepID=UPI00315C9A45
MDLLLKMGLAARKIYLHCFTGSQVIFERWHECGPNVYFGVSSLICRNQELQKVATEIPADRLVLESDAPYLPSYGTTPWASLELVLAKLTVLLKKPEPLILQQSILNTRRLYRI